MGKGKGLGHFNVLTYQPRCSVAGCLTLESGCRGRTKHWSLALRLLSSLFVLNDAPMPNENAVFDTQNLGRDPVHWETEATELRRPHCHHAPFAMLRQLTYVPVLLEHSVLDPHDVHNDELRAVGKREPAIHHHVVVLRHHDAVIPRSTRWKRFHQPK